MNAIVSPLALELRGVSRTFGNISALQNISLSARPAEIITLFGKSGSGKSTLLRCIDLLEPIDDGSILYGAEFQLERRSGRLNLTDLNSGASYTVQSFGDRVRRHIGFVSQSYDLWEERSVLQNLVLAPVVVLGEEVASAEQRARSLCDRFGLAEKLGARAWELSGGQRQRIAIIRALMMRPRLLLLDEIASSLDPVLTYEVMELIRELKRDGMTMLLVTHHLKFGLAISDRVVFLQDGRIVQDCSPDDFLSAPANPDVQEFIEVLRSLG